jgi:aryl-alcohol dehydrogenase-like predicted oxidoreductase
MTQQIFSERIALGASDLRIRPLGVGAWQWGDRMSWGYGRGYGEDDVRQAFDVSIKAGLDFYDSAEVYGFGRSERLLGHFARSISEPVIIATKFLPFPWRLRRKSLVNALRRSLKRLGMNHVDLYQIHWPIPTVPIETWMSAMADCVDEGLLRAVGVSNFNIEQTQRAHTALAERGIPLASNQIPYSMLHRRPERNHLLASCKKLNVAVIAYSPLEQGLLTGKYTPDNPPPGARGRRLKPGYLEKLMPLIGMMREIGSGHGDKSPAQVALNWTMCKGTIPIPGPKNERQAAENAGALGWRLGEDEVSALDKASEDLV